MFLTNLLVEVAFSGVYSLNAFNEFSGSGSK